MSESGLVAVEKSNPGLTNRFRVFGTIVPLRLAFPRLARVLWPDKTDAELAVRIGLSDRACRKILAESANISAEALRALLLTDDGLAVLEMMMGSARPKWWRRFKRQMAFADVRGRIDEAKAKLEALEREEIE